MNQAENNTGITPLCIASYKGHLEIVKLLIESGGSVNQAQNTGITLLWIASQEGHLEVVKLLIESGGSPEKEEEDED